MNILTKEEIEFWVGSNQTKKAMARAIEAAVLKKLAEQDAEPVAHLHVGRLFSNELEDWEIEAEEDVCDRINEESYGKDLSLNLYTETQLIAAQQKAAEACAEYLIKGNHPDELVASKGMIAGEWRDYL